MALTLIATVGGITSNVYDTLANAEIYFEGRLNKSAWTGASSENKKASLVHATTVLDAEEYNGEKTIFAQRLKWARVNVEDDDGFIIEGTVIPKEMKEAMFELALVLLSSDIQEHSELAKFKVMKVGEITLEPLEGTINVLPDEVQKLISRFQIISNKLIRG